MLLLTILFSIIIITISSSSNSSRSSLVVVDEERKNFTWRRGFEASVAIVTEKETEAALARLASSVVVVGCRGILLDQMHRGESPKEFRPPSYPGQLQLPASLFYPGRSF